MKKQTLFFVIALLMGLFLLSACAADATPEPESAAPTAEPAPADTGAQADDDPDPEPYPAAEDASADQPAPSESDTAAYPPPTGDSAAVVADADPYPAPDAAGMRTFVIDPAASEASYTVEEEFLSGAVDNLGKILGDFTAIGTTTEVAGQLTLSVEGAPAVAGGDFTVNIQSLSSDDDRRDKRIRERYLESDTYPVAAFTITSVDGMPGTYEEGAEITFTMTGDLTIREETKSVTFDVTATLNGDTLTGVATAQILMTDYGFDPPSIAGFLEASDEVLITITFTAKEGTP